MPSHSKVSRRRRTSTYRVATALAMTSILACGSDSDRPDGVANTELVFREPLYEEFGVTAVHNPARAIRLLHQAEGLTDTERTAWWRCLQELQYHESIFLAIAAVEGALAEEPPLEFRDFAEAQREVREVFPLYPAVWVGGLPYQLDASYFVDPRSGGSVVPLMDEELDDWVMSGCLIDLSSVADDPLASMDEFLRSPELRKFEQRFIPAVGTWSKASKIEHMRTDLRDQAYRTLGGVLDRPLRIALRKWKGPLRQFGEAEWRIACRVARECQVTWNPVLLAYEWGASLVDLVASSGMRVDADVGAVSEAMLNSLADRGYTVTENEPVGSDRWIRASRGSGAQVRAFIHSLPDEQAEIVFRGLSGKSEGDDFSPSQTLLDELGLREQLAPQVVEHW